LVIINNSDDFDIAKEEIREKGNIELIIHNLNESKKQNKHPEV